MSKKISENIFAAIDLGSNSFRMETAKVVDGKYQKIKYIKKTVRLGGGLDEQNKLIPSALACAYECLELFAQEIGGLRTKNILAVATQTLREAINRDEFIATAEDILRIPVKIISGKEEAKLIYHGANSFLPNIKEKRLVIDIGGRSTEIILGEGNTPKLFDSIPIGSVNISQKFFSSGIYNQEIFTQAISYVTNYLQNCLQELQIIPNSLLLQDISVYGTSGTIGSVVKILEDNKIDNKSISWASLQWFYQKMLSAGEINNLQIKGLPEERKAVIVGGLSILIAIYKTLQIKNIIRCEGGLRHGILQKLMFPN